MNNRAFHRSGRPHGLEETDHCSAELCTGDPAVSARGPDLRRFLASEGVGERAAEHEHVVEHVVHRELGARRRVVELGRLEAARAALAGGDLGQAIDEAGASVAAWTDIGAPFESAVARVVLGDAHHRSGNAVRARMEWQAARSAFEDFGAAVWVERIGGLLADASAASASTTVRTEQPKDVTATFRCDGDTRTVSFGECTVLVRDLKGLRYLARLLAEPGREFHVLDLVAVEQGTLPLGSPVDEGALGLDTGAGLPLIDEQAREAYRRRLAEVDEDIEEATRMSDLGRLELAQRDRDYLIAELTHSVGLGGRHRTVGGTAERARTSVTRSLRYAITRLSEHHPVLATHLEQAVHTGTYCRYTPDPLARVVWEVSVAERW